VAGAFYPADPRALRASVDAALAGAARSAERRPTPTALVVPHAGYPYSAPVAASAFARIAAGAEAIERVVLVGPSHLVPLRGMAVSGAAAFATPLGEVPLDDGLRAVALGHPAVGIDDEAHAGEHSIEVQLPFLQVLLGGRFALLPLLTGACPPGAVGEVLDAVWGGDDTLVVVSTDLSHYHGHDRATALDRRTAAAVVVGRADRVGPADACGATGLRGLMEVARRRELRTELLDLRTSGDTAGDRDRVVGYGAFAVA
jgi:AmmeMemoRadiSam system protein B